MAVSKDDLLFKIDVQAQEAVKSIKNLEDVFGGLGMQVLKANAAVDLAVKSFEAFRFVISKIAQPFEDAIDSSIEYAAALNKLRNALKLTGQFSETTVRRFEDFGEAMELNTTLTQEQAYEMLALAKVVGVTDDQAMQMVQTAKDLATVTGKDVNDSFRALLGSLRGNSRELLALDPTLKKFGASAFMSGEAIDYLSVKLDGFAASSAKGFKGVREQAQNFRDEIGRNIGDVLAVAFDIKGTEDFKRAMYLNILRTVEEVKPQLMAFAEGVREIKRELMGGISEAARSFSATMASVGRVIAVIDFQTMAIGLTALAASFGAVVIAMKVDAILVFITTMQSLTVTLLAFTKVALAAAAPLAIFALKIAAIGAAIGAAMIAVDFFNKNGIKPVVAGFTMLIGKIEEIIGKFMQFVGLFQAGGKLIADGWRIQNKAAQDFSKVEMGDGLKATIDKVKEIKDAWTGTGAAAKAAGDEQKKITGAFAGRSVVDPAAQEAYLQALDAIKQKTDQLNLEAERSGLTQIELIERQLEMTLKAIDAEKERINLSKQFTDAQKKNLTGALDKQKAAATNEAESKMARAPGQEFDAVKVAGASIMNDVTKAFQTGTLGMVTGFLGVADMFLDAAKGLIDFLPNIFNKAADVFNSLTDLPNKLVSALGNFLQSIMNFISNAIPNLLKAIPQIMRMIVQFLVKGLPEAFNALFDAVPDLIMQLIEAIPDFVEGLVQFYVQNIDVIVMAFIEKIIPQLPRIVTGLVKTLSIELPKAIWRGIVKGFNALAASFKNLFKGVKILDQKDINKAVADIKKLTGATAALFGVRDLGETQKTMAKTGAEVSEAMKKGMADGVKILLDAWRWIYEKIISPIGGLFKEIFNGAVNGIHRIFGFFKEIFDRMSSFLGKLFEGLKNIGPNLLDSLKDIGGIIVDGIKGGLPGIGKMFQELFDQLNPANLFKKMFDTSGAYTEPGTVEGILGINVPFLSFAKGGLVPGKARVGGDSSFNDRILALLSPGEAIIPRSAMEDERVRAVVDQILSGKLDVPAFKLGGFVGKVVNAATGGATSMGGVAGKILSGDFGGVAEDLRNLDPKQVAEELQKAGEKATDVLEAMLPGNPWKMVWDKVKEMIFKMFEANRFAQGGLVTGMGGTDMIPARLTAGEFVLNRGAVQSIGVGNLNRLNAGGGMTPANITQNIEIRIESKGERLDESFVRQRLMPVIKDELKRASLDGERLLSSGGVR